MSFLCPQFLPIIIFQSSTCHVAFQIPVHFIENLILHVCSQAHNFCSYVLYVKPSVQTDYSQSMTSTFGRVMFHYSAQKDLGQVNWLILNVRHIQTILQYVEQAKFTCNHPRIHVSSRPGIFSPNFQSDFPSTNDPIIQLIIHLLIYLSSPPVSTVFFQQSALH